MKDSKLYSVVIELVTHLKSVLDIDTLKGSLATDHVISGKLHLELPDGEIHILDVSFLNDVQVESEDEE